MGIYMAKNFDDIKRNGTMIKDIACFSCKEHSLKYLGSQTIEQNEKYPYVVSCLNCGKGFYYDHDTKDYEEIE
jgi:DNA-directed RNA polymerase subunit M/transcription elongation factor TFIIS